MKPAHHPPSRQQKSIKTLQRKFGNVGSKSAFRDQNMKRQRMVYNINAGHVRGGHSFH